MVKFRHLALAFVALTVAALLAAPQARAAITWKKKCDNIIILYDISGSMAEKYKDTGKTKFDLAEQLMEETVAEIPDLDYKVGLYSFTPFKAYYPLQPFNKGAFIKAVDSLPDKVPGGILGHGTPLGKAMKELDTVLSGTSGKTVVYLVTDGQNTDDMNPYRAAKKVAEAHDVCFYIISLSPWKNGNKIMRKISALGRPCTKLYQIEKVMNKPAALVYPVAEAVDTPEPLVVVEEEEVVVVEQITPVVEFVEITFFDFDKIAIKPGAQEALDEVGSFMRENLDQVAVISGFTDSTGSAEYNMGLSKRRAEAVRDYLVSNFGIDKERFVLHWYGLNDPIAPNDTFEGRAKNRRAELVMIGAR